MSNHSRTAKGYLRVRLLGQSIIEKDDLQLTDMLSGKAHALLAYLMLTRGVHSRVFSASLLWSDQSDSQAKKNLRNVLPDLRSRLSEHFIITRQSLEFDTTSAYELDAEQFERVIAGKSEQIALPTLENALALYRGEFMAGFHVRGARLYESWLRQQRAYFQRLAVSGWETLGQRYLLVEDPPAAERAATQLLTLESFNEVGHRIMMQSLHMQGRLQEALAQYGRCVEMLQTELGVTVSAETQALYEHLKTAPVRKPIVAENQAKSAKPSHNLIGREPELKKLQEKLAQAQAKSTQLVLVKGERGSGKSYLLDTFAQMVDTEEVRVLSARGSDITSSHTPYRIFHNLLRSLGGRWPEQNQAVLDHVLRKVQGIAKRQPLLLILDDLHWADSASWALFYELVQQAGKEACLLIAASYRVSWQHDSQWGSVLSELTHQPTCTMIDLDKARRREGESFIHNLLDARPNQLASHFRKRLFTLTQGHPLLTVEFLRDLEEREVIDRAKNGTLQLQKPSIWDDLPEKFVALLESWLQPLSPELRELLRVASVEGDEFTASVVKAALPSREMHVFAQQLGLLDRRYGIIDALEPIQLGQKTHPRYHFRYPIMRQYIYERTLTPLERETLPEVLGLALDRLYSV